MVTAISKEVEGVVDTHTARDAAWYNEVGFPASTRFRVYIEGIRRPTQASFSLKNSSAYVVYRHCLAYCRGSLPEDAEKKTARSRCEACVLSPVLRTAQRTASSERLDPDGILSPIF